jgi:glycosyltransferase involved in cell wall biosynthesis
MINISLVCRIASDKNFINDIIEAVNNVSKEALNSFKLNIIGGVYDYEIYDKILNRISDNNINHLVEFTEKSIRYIDLPLLLKEGYFINFSLADSIGYSGIESLSFGYKSIFYNVDHNCKNIVNDFPYSFSLDIASLTNCFKNIINNSKNIDKEIKKENKKLLEQFKLSMEDRQLLKSWI